MSGPFSDYLSNVTGKKKKKNPFDTTINPYANLGESDQPSLEDTLHTVSDTGINRTQEVFQPKIDNGFISVQRTDTPYVPKELHPMDLLSGGLNASTKFMDSMATKGYSIWDTITPNVINKLIEKGPVTFIKDVGASLSDVGTEVKQIATNALGESTNIKQLADYAKMPEEQFTALPQPIKNQIMQNYDKENKPEQLSSFDLIKKYHPDFVEEHPIASHLMSFVGDVALDPTTYIGFESALPRLAGKTLTREGITAVRELNELAEVGFRATIENKGFTHIIDFGPSEVRQLRYVEDTLGTSEAQKVLGNYLSSYGDVKSVAPLNAVQRQESVENTFLRLTRSDPSLTQAEGLGVFARIPVIGEIPLIKPETVNKVLDTIGVSKIKNSIIENLSTKPVEAVRYAFQRDYKLPETYLTARKSLEGQLNLVDHKVMATAERFGKLSKDSRINLTELASRIDTRILEKTDALQAKYVGLKEEVPANKYGGMYNYNGNTIPVQVNSLNNKIYISAPGLNQIAVDTTQEIIPKLESLGYKRAFDLPEGKAIKAPPLSDRVINATRQSSINDAIRNGKITPEEFDVFSRFVAHQNQFAQIETESKLYRQAAQNSINKEKGVFFKADMRARAFGEGLDDELAKGFVPENDLAVLHALQMKTTLYKQAEDHFNATVKVMYGSLENAPKQVKADLDLIGQRFHSANIESMLKPLLDLYDNGLNKWRTLAYAVKPAAAPRQFISNTLQAYSVLGARAFKAFDPRSILEAGLLMADKSAYAKFVPQYLLDGVQKFGTIPGKMMYAINRMEPQLVDKISYVNRLGERIDGPQLMQELIDHDIYHKGSNILDLDTTHNLKLDIAKANGFVEWQKERWHEGFWTFFKESIPWINAPQQVETMGKISVYHNARMMGYLPEQAKELTTKALFDYAEGLSGFEKSVAKRFVPFYTFQRFAVPLIASLVKEPGRATTLKKITESFFEVWNDVGSGQKLTEQQRQVLPGLLLEQPSVFEGVDTSNPNNKDTNIFRTFNNFSFTDMFSLVKLKVDGSIDIGGTVQKATLAQLTPLLKVPLELLFDKNFFTDATISKGGKFTSGDKVKQFEDNVPDLIKHTLGYEVKTDLATGKQTGYINPYLSYMMSSFVPAINDYVRISRDDLNAHEFAMQYLGGVGTTKLNFEEARKGKIYEWKNQIKELQQEMRRHYVTGRSDVINDDQAKLQELIKSINKIQNLDLQTPR